MDLANKLLEGINSKQGVERDKYIEAINCLHDYECVKGVRYALKGKNKDTLLCNEEIKVVRDKCPCYLERVKMDANRLKQYELKDGRLFMHDVELVVSGEGDGGVSGFRFANTV